MSVMGPLVGATYDPRGVARAREYLLLFDRIACPTAAALIDGKADDAHALRVLREHGVVFCPSLPRARTREAAENERVLRFARMPEDAGFAVTDLAARTLAVHLHHVDGIRAVPLTTAAWRRIQPVILTDVLELVVRDLPLPAAEEGLLPLLEFRRELRSEGLVHALRGWLSAMASGTLAGRDGERALADVIDRFAQVLGRRRSARAAGTVHALSITSAEVAAVLQAFPWSRAALRRFAVKGKRIGLMPSELTRIGGEVAYILTSRHP